MRLERVLLGPGLRMVILDEPFRGLDREHSRLYMARTLVQEANLVILDASFVALDPKTLQSCLRFVLKRAATVLVIAHP